MIEDIKVKPGVYVAAISGGVDSIALLDMLSGQPGVRLVVAHVDHGIRTDSGEDARLVESLATKYGHRFEKISLSLGPRVSEATAREVRHAWLQSIRRKYNALSIITAHHRDDIVETMLINLLRGTGWRGLNSLRDTDIYQRPLLHVPKVEIVRHAIDHSLEWREDSTNDDLRYLRNYVRHGIASKLTNSQVNKLLELYIRQGELRKMISEERKMLHKQAVQGDGLSRYWLIMTPDSVAIEFLRHHYGSLTRDSARKLLHYARTARPGAKLSLSRDLVFLVTKSELIVCTPEDC